MERSTIFEAVWLESITDANRTERNCELHSTIYLLAGIKRVGCSSWRNAVGGVGPSAWQKRYALFDGNFSHHQQGFVDIRLRPRLCDAPGESVREDAFVWMVMGQHAIAHETGSTQRIQNVAREGPSYGHM